MRYNELSACDGSSFTWGFTLLVEHKGVMEHMQSHDGDLEGGVMDEVPCSKFCTVTPDG